MSSTTPVATLNDQPQLVDAVPRGAEVQLVVDRVAQVQDAGRRLPRVLVDVDAGLDERGGGRVREPAPLSRRPGPLQLEAVWGKTDGGFLTQMPK